MLERKNRRRKYDDLLLWLARETANRRLYPVLPRGAELPADAHGFRREWGGRRFVAIPVERVDRRIDESYRRWVKRKLAERGYLVVSTDGKYSRQIQLFGENGRRRWPTFDIEKLDRMASN